MISHIGVTVIQQGSELHDATSSGIGFIGERKNKAESSRREGISHPLFLQLSQERCTRHNMGLMFSGETVLSGVFLLRETKLIN